MKRLFLTAALLLAPAVAQADTAINKLDCSRIAADIRCIRVAHSRWSQQIAKINGVFAKKIAAIHVKFAQDYEKFGYDNEKAQEKVNERYVKVEAWYQAKVKEACDSYVLEKLGASQRQADRLAEYVIGVGQYPISDKLTDVWVQQIIWL